MSDILSHDPSLPAPAGEQPLPASASVRRQVPRLRLWPGIVIIALQWVFITLCGWLAPGTPIQFFGMFLSPVVGAVAFIAWWLFASRLRWADCGLTLLACALIGAAAYLFFHSSFNLFGVVLYALPAVTTAWLLWLVATPFLRWPARRTGLLIVFLLVWGYFTTLRFEGVTGDFAARFTHRWTPTAEEQFLAERAGRQAPAGERLEDTYVALVPGDWPGFRGPKRDGRLTGVRIATDWQTPPRQLWRQRVGPGWSSFAVVGRRLYTQEQRGEGEVVVCYDSDTGAEQWLHRDAARFTELVGGPGPRATPTFHEGKIYALGATGLLNCLDAASGRSLWSRDIVADSGAKVPEWGFASSPLIAHGLVTVYAGAPGKCVLAYHASSGAPAWSAGEGDKGYSSTQLVRLDGVEQLLIASNAGLTAFHPVKGDVLWQHDWPSEKVARVVQPAVVGDADLLLGTAFTFGTRRLHVTRGADGWTAKELWTKTAIKPYYNDMVVHGEHLYGFDGVFFTCVRLDDGKARWRARGYGHGQVLLLADQDLLLITSEQGEVALVEASPNGHNELARFQAIEGKTWNHPVVAHGKLFVRNGEEAACYQLKEIGTK